LVVNGLRLINYLRKTPLRHKKTCNEEPKCPLGQDNMFCATQNYQSQAFVQS
jgi:hypothetical protein